MDSHDPELLGQANRLYWDSDASVNEIADEMDLSKSALYGMIQPLATGLPCPDCGDILQFANRTARERDIVTCSSCGFEEDAALVEAAAVTGVDAVPGPPPAVREAEEAEYKVTVRTLVASTFLGLAAGLAIGQLTRRS